LIRLAGDQTYNPQGDANRPHRNEAALRKCFSDLISTSRHCANVTVPNDNQVLWPHRVAQSIAIFLIGSLASLNFSAGQGT